MQVAETATTKALLGIDCGLDNEGHLKDRPGLGSVCCLGVGIIHLASQNGGRGRVCTGLGNYYDHDQKLHYKDA